MTTTPILTLRRRPGPPPGPAGLVTLNRRRRGQTSSVPPASIAEAAAARIQELEAQLTAERAQLAELVQRAHREERVEAITLRVVDRRAEYAAKTSRGRSAAVTITSHYVDVH